MGARWNDRPLCWRRSPGFQVLVNMREDLGAVPRPHTQRPQLCGHSVTVSDFPGDTSSKEPTCQCRKHKRLMFIPWVGKIPWRRAWQPMPYSCLENPMDREAWRAIVHRFAKSQTQLKRLSMDTVTVGHQP